MLKEKVCFGNKLCKFHTDLINSEFLFYFLQSPIFLNNFKDNISGLIGGVGTTKIKKMYIPLPDIEEQNEIVRVIKEFETLLIDIKYAEEKLDALKSSFPANMRKSIIHFALQGKMNDRYYSENVDDIILSCCNKKQKLINDKMIKEDKEIEELKPDEIPYEIPSNWRWIRFGKVIKLLSGQDLTSDKYFSSEKENAIPYLTGASNIENGKIIINRWTDSPTSIACKGNILLTCKGTIGTTCVLDIEKVHIARQIMAIDCFDIDTKYVLYFIENFVFKLQSKAKSMIPGIDRNTVLNLPFALPPLHEQREIVKKIDEIIPLLNIIENTLKNKETKK